MTRRLLTLYLFLFVFCCLNSPELAHSVHIKSQLLDSSSYLYSLSSTQKRINPADYKGTYNGTLDRVGEVGTFCSEGNSTLDISDMVVKVKTDGRITIKLGSDTYTGRTAGNSVISADFTVFSLGFSAGNIVTLSNISSNDALMTFSSWFRRRTNRSDYCFSHYSGIVSRSK